VKWNVRRSVSTRHAAGSNSRSVNRFGIAWSRDFRLRSEAAAKAARTLRAGGFFFGARGGRVDLAYSLLISWAFGTILRSALQWWLEATWRIRMSAVSDTPTTEMPMPFVFTDAAAEKVKQLIDEEGNPDLKLRVFVQGGGCSGFQYGFTFDEEVNEDDTVMDKSGVQLLVDSMSYQYLVGAEIDYKDDLNGAQFVIKNPNATTTCGCGSSFSV
jgi:iron-sulfur cluster insertion protein